jgi:hypothetical protein
MKIADSVKLSLNMRENEKVQHPSSPPAPVLKCGTQFSMLKNVGINDTKGPEKCDTEVTLLYGYHTTFDTCCCEVLMS